MSRCQQVPLENAGIVEFAWAAEIEQRPEAFNLGATPPPTIRETLMNRILAFAALWFLAQAGQCFAQTVGELSADDVVQEGNFGVGAVKETQTAPPGKMFLFPFEAMCAPANSPYVQIPEGRFFTVSGDSLFTVPRLQEALAFPPYSVNLVAPEEPANSKQHQSLIADQTKLIAGLFELVKELQETIVKLENRIAALEKTATGGM